MGLLAFGLTTARVFPTRVFTPDEALDYILKHTGTLFDPQVTHRFSQVIETLIPTSRV